MQDSYRELFLSESQEYLSIVSNCLVKLEDNPSDMESLNEIFRCIHTLKGMSATMGFDKLTRLSHQMESLLDELRGQRKKITPEIMDALFATVDILEQLTEEVKLKQESKIDINLCLENLKNLFTAQPGSLEANDTPKEVKKVPQGQEIVLEFSDEELGRLKQIKDNGFNIFKIKVVISKDCTLKEARLFLVMNNLQKIGEIEKSFPPLEDLRQGKIDYSFVIILVSRENQDIVRRSLLAVSEIESVEVGNLDITIRPQAQAGGASYVKKIQSMRIPVERLDKIMNLMGELAIAKIRLVQISQSRNIEALESVSVVLDRLISSLQDEVMQTRLLPASYVMDTFPRMVRDLAKKQSKEVSLEITGGEIELDRVALDEISDPMVHLIRNAIDHGIETPQERKMGKKDPCGKLVIQVSRQKGQIFIEIKDDGRGVDFEAVKRVALNKGLIPEEELKGIDEKRILDLITLPGFSTAKKVTDISGRGVGLDVVKSKIEALGGRLEFETVLGQGSRFILTLPLTLAIIKAMLVRVEQEIFALPLMSVREIIKINEDELKFIQHFEVARVREEIIPIVRLNKELGIEIGTVENKPAGADERLSVIIIEYGQKALGLVVSQVLGEQDIVVKPLGTIIKRTKGIAGATILGDGKVALILDTMSLR